VTLARGAGRRRSRGIGGLFRDVGLISPSFQAWRKPLDVFLGIVLAPGERRRVGRGC
jgi:hypothetical protein